ncbi:hypothetical protein BGZ81_003648, partial [Podila clonocystis]
MNAAFKHFKHFDDVFNLHDPVNSPEILEYILKTNFNNYIKGKIFYNQLRDILGHRTFVSDGDPSTAS